LESTVLAAVTSGSLIVKSINWLADRLEVVVTCQDYSLTPTSDQLEQAHHAVYNAFEASEIGRQYILNHEVLIRLLPPFLKNNTLIKVIVASPGIGEYLVTDKDFISFKVNTT